MPDVLKVSEELKNLDSYTQIPTLTDLFSKIFASNKNSHLDTDFWTQEQWEKGIEGLPTAESGGKTEHWFHTGRFNTLINVIDKKFQTMIEKVQAFITYVKTIDATLVSRLQTDELDDTELLKRLYESLYDEYLVVGFHNLKNPSPQNVCKLLDKLGVVTKREIAVTSIVQRLNAKNEIKFLEPIKWKVLRTNNTVHSSGTFSNPMYKIIQNSKNEIEFELYLSRGGGAVSDSGAYTIEISFTGCTIPIEKAFFRTALLPVWSCKTFGILDSDLFCISDGVDTNTPFTIKKRLYVPSSFRHDHTYRGDVASANYAAGWTYVNRSYMILSGSEFYPLSVNNDFLTKLNLSAYQFSQRSFTHLGKITTKTISTTTNTVKSHSPIEFSDVHIRGVLWRG